MKLLKCQLKLFEFVIDSSIPSLVLAGCRNWLCYPCTISKNNIISIQVPITETSIFVESGTAFLGIFMVILPSYLFVSRRSISIAIFSYCVSPSGSTFNSCSMPSPACDVRAVTLTLINPTRLGRITNDIEVPSFD